MPEYFVGLMSGTSADGVDAVCVTFRDAPSAVRVLAHHYTPYPPDVRARVLALMTPGDDEIERLGALEGELAEIFAAAARGAHEAAGLPARAVGAIGSHGQTLRHRPSGPWPFTLQIGDPARVSERTGIATVADFRRRDLAAGGQGAPLVPAFHRWLFAHPQRTRAIVNIGGIANVTVIPKGEGHPLHGFDTGPGNALLDAWIHKETGALQDTDGAFAAHGQVREEWLTELLGDGYFAQAPPKSTGREHFTLDWLTQHLKGPMRPAADVQATLVELTALTIARALSPFAPDEVFACGGGTANPVLMRRLGTHLPGPLATTHTLGLDPRLVEPVAFAWLAREALAGRPGNAPSATGARHPVVLGAIYPP